MNVQRVVVPPDFTSLGSDASITIPDIGNGDGDLIEGDRLLLLSDIFQE